MKKIIVKIMLTVLSVIFVVPFVVSCGEKESNDTDSMYSTYLVVRDNFDNRITLHQNTRGQFIYEYDEEVEYSYHYDEFSNDGELISSGNYENKVKGDRSGTLEQTIKVPIKDPKNNDIIGLRYYTFYAIIGGKPEGWAIPEVYFDLRGGTIEGEGDNLTYVYYEPLNNRYKYPLLHLRYEDEDIEITDKAANIVGWRQGNYYEEGSQIWLLGVCKVYYKVDFSGYVNKADREKYKDVDICITVEIRA